MNEENQVYFIDSDELPSEVLARKHRLEQDPSSRTNHMEYLPNMEIIESDIQSNVRKAMEEYDYDSYTAADVQRALSNDTCSIEDFKALLSPAAAPFLEQMARKAEEITKKYLRDDLICDNTTDTFFMAAYRLFEITENINAKQRVEKKMQEYQAMISQQ